MTRAAMRHLALRAAVLALTAGAAGCAAFGEHDPNAPSWFKAKVKETEKEPFPKLASAPEPTPSTKSQNEWDAIETQAKAAGADMAASSRNDPPNMTAADIEAFDQKAREEVAGAPKP
ncbi:MAG TPA: hypothetical protein VG983_11275 [Caulobacterales bacterium]|nr:hypothetical protein [Caulobacterales bacterium]